jgi:hypothetical protein
VDSPYYAEWELCEGVVTVSFFEVPPLASDAPLIMSTHFSKMCCRLFATSFRRIVEQVVLTFQVRFSISIGLMDEL